jgi:hypothetical protein
MKRSTLLELLTNSRATCFRRCQREHQYRYIDGIVPLREGDALRFGTLMHHALEAWWNAVKAGLSPEERLRAALSAIDAKRTPETDEYDLARAKALMVGYDARWGAECYEVIAVEAEFRAPLVNPETGAESRTYQLAGKLDVLARDERGRVLIIEHKTSGQDISSGSTYWQKLRLDSQVSMYFGGAAALGHQPEVCVYDVIGKPRLRPYEKNTKRAADETADEFFRRLTSEIASAPDKYFQRGEIVRLEGELARHQREQWAQAHTMREARRLNVAPMNPDSCAKFGDSSLCGYFEACCGSASLDDTTRFKRLESVNPELSSQQEEKFHVEAESRPSSINGAGANGIISGNGGTSGGGEIRF